MLKVLTLLSTTRRRLLKDQIGNIFGSHHLHVRKTLLVTLPSMRPIRHLERSSRRLIRRVWMPQVVILVKP